MFINLKERTKFKMELKDNKHLFRCKNINNFYKLNSTTTFLIICILILNLIIPIHSKGCLNIWMDGKETAKCDGQGLISVPSDLSSSIHVIRLENNNFQILPSKVFQERKLINLQKIFLSNCTLGMIASDAFLQLNHLVELDLSQNLLTSVPSDSFKNLINVRRLLLRQNPIKTLRENNFAHLTRLEHIDLSHCQIDQIEGGSFKSLQSLKSLKLNNNRLTTLAANVFNDIPPLYTIALEHNLWNCDCELRPLHKWISDNNMLLEPPQCKTPAKFENKAWSKMYIDELACLPVMMPTETENSGHVGSNATFKCKIKSSPKPEIDWHIEEPTNNLIPSQPSSSPQPPYTFNTFSTNPYLNQNQNSIANSDDRYLISESLIENDDIIISTFTLINLQPEDTQRKFICNAKNNAGLGKETFTINVYSASTGVLKSGSFSYTILIFLFILICFLLIGLLVFKRHRKQTNSGTNGLSDNKLDVLKNVKNSLVGNHHIKKTTTTNNNLDNQTKIDSQKLKINTNGDVNTNGTLYVNGYTNSKQQTADLMNSNATKFNSSNLQFNQSAVLSSYGTNLNSNGLTVLNQNNDLINNSTSMLNYDHMINVGPQDFTPTNQTTSSNLLTSSQYGTSAFVQSPINNLMPYQTNATISTNYLDQSGGYLGSNEQLLNGFNNYENMYSSPFNQQQQYLIQQQQNAYGIYGTTASAANIPPELQMQTTINPTAVDDLNTASIYYQNTIDKRNSPLINNISQNNQLINQDMSIYATLQNSQLNNLQHHVNILGSYDINAQPTAVVRTTVRYSPDDEGYSEETANSTNFTLEGTEV